MLLQQPAIGDAIRTSSLHEQDDMNEESSRMDRSITDVGLKAIPPATVHKQDDLNEESSRLDGGSTDVGLKQIPPLCLNKQHGFHEDSSRLDIGSANVDFEEIPLSSGYQHDELREKSSRVAGLSNGTPRQKSTTDIVALGGRLDASNCKDENIASSSKIDKHACWRRAGVLTIAKKCSEWYEAILVSDCKSLMEQLNRNELLVLQTGHNGCSVLHAAARRGCTMLVNQVMHLFKDSLGFITGKDHTKILVCPLHDLFQAEDFRTKLRAVDIMENFLGRNVIRLHMDRFYGDKFSASRRAVVGDDVVIPNEGNNDVYCTNTSRSMTWQKLVPKCLEQNDIAKGRSQGKAKHVSASCNVEPIDPNQLAEIHNIIDKLVNNGNHKELMEEYSKDKDYNFETRKEYFFHYACQSMSRHSVVPRSITEEEDKLPKSLAEEFLCSFIKELGGDEEILRSLYGMQNWQGKTPCHVALNGSTFGFERLLVFLRNYPMTIDSFFNACDARGWTPLHKAVAMVSEHDCWRHRRFVTLLLKNEEVDVNGKLPNSHATPLHLAILHNLPQVVGSLIESPKDIDVVINASLKRNIRYSSTTQPSRWSSKWWSPLQLATVMGHRGVVHALISKIDMIYDVSKLKNKGVAPKTYDDKIPAIHLAAASGVPEVLQLFLDKEHKIFDPAKITTQKRTTLHFAVDTIAPYMVHRPACKANNFVNSFQCISDFGDAQHLGYIVIKASKKPVVDDHVGKDNGNYPVVNLDQVTQKSKNQQLITLEEYGGKQACISMLLQDGVDIWQRDDQRRFAELGAETSNEIRMWWFEKIAQETSATKRTLNDAANAISVVAALIATASYVGPFQPPLGLGTVTTSSYFDLVQTSSVPVRIFVVSNCLSFYLAIGCIMFAIMPSVPMPKHGIRFEEWQRSRRTVCVALCLLLGSVFCVLVSFAAASNAGMSNDVGYHHLGLAFYPALAGGLFCLIGFIIFLVGFMRFIKGFGMVIKKNLFKQNFKRLVAKKQQRTCSHKQ